MNSVAPMRPATRASTARAGVGLLILVATLTAGCGALPAPSLSSSSTLTTSGRGDGGAGLSALGRPVRPVLGRTTARDPGSAPGRADGVLPAGTTVFDDGVPGVANLNPGLLSALRRAAATAAADRVEFVLHSGWRSPQYQEQLLRAAITTYGSPQEAARWVATPETSAHVTGEAVDVASDAAAWLSAHGAEYGLCQIYGNESWHYELRPDAIEHGCPARYADAAHDPRMHP